SSGRGADPDALRRRSRRPGSIATDVLEPDVGRLERLEHAEVGDAAAVGHQARHERLRPGAHEKAAVRPGGNGIAAGIEMRPVDLPTELPGRKKTARAIRNV